MIWIKLLYMDYFNNVFIFKLIEKNANYIDIQWMDKSDEKKKTLNLWTT